MTSLKCASARKSLYPKKVIIIWSVIRTDLFVKYCKQLCCQDSVRTYNFCTWTAEDEIFYQESCKGLASISKEITAMLWLEFSLVAQLCSFREVSHVVKTIMMFHHILPVHRYKCIGLSGGTHWRNSAPYKHLVCFLSTVLHVPACTGCHHAQCPTCWSFYDSCMASTQTTTSPYSLRMLPPSNASCPNVRKKSRRRKRRRPSWRCVVVVEIRNQLPSMTLHSICEQ